jgi:uncharacterized protein
VRRKRLLWLLFVAALSAIQYAGRFSSGKPDRNVLYHYSAAIGSAVQYAVFLGIVLAIGGLDRSVYALRRPRSWPRALGSALALVVLLTIAIASLDSVLHGGREQGLTPTRWEPSHAGAYAASFVVVAVFGPIVEELLFRGLGFYLLLPFGPWPAIVGTGLAFGLYHGLVEALPELVLFGCALAWLRWRTDSVFPGMILHGTFNALSLVAAVASSH